MTTTLETADRARQRELTHLRSENSRLRLIVSTIIPALGCFDPENDDQVERIALEWTTRYWKMKNRLKELDPDYE
jgi:hypothetical protein